MNRLIKTLEQKPSNLLNLFFTAGFPYLTDTITILKTLQNSEVDIVEIGMPYSDPLADGTTIQESSTIALKNGMKLQLLFEQLNSIKEDNNIPIILMGYYNQLLQYGLDRFLDDCKNAGVDGLIIPDLPLSEYEAVLKDKLEARDIAISFLITPNTSTERVDLIKRASTGFVYVVADNSITGKSKDISDEQIQYFKRTKKLMDTKPHLIGFGIKDNTSFRQACDYANGAIIGSAFIKALKEMKDLEQEIPKWVKSIKTNEVIPNS